jgi:protein-S-isoprenylcysteine O-methyltransferase Ste14
LEAIDALSRHEVLPCVLEEAAMSAGAIGLQATHRSEPSFFHRVVTNPTLDRVIAIIAIVPASYLVYFRFHNHPLNIPLLSAQINTLLLIGTMVTRRPPVRVTPNPWFWLLAFVATYGLYTTVFLSQRGVALVPSLLTDGIALLSLLFAASARITLGRNIGFVPAQRKLVMTGPYKYVRHPIYTGLFLTLISLDLRAYSVRNLAMTSTIAVLFIIKSVVEESFLKEDPQYAEYMKRVRCRWLPGIV